MCAVGIRRETDAQRREKRRSLLAGGKERREIQKKERKKLKKKVHLLLLPFYFDDKFTLLGRTGRQFCIGHSTQLVTIFGFPNSKLFFLPRESGRNKNICNRLQVVFSN